jgi:hypothetical protein
MRGSRCICMCFGGDFVQALLRPYESSFKALLKRERDPLTSTTLAFASSDSSEYLYPRQRNKRRRALQSCPPRRCSACEDALRRCSNARAPAATPNTTEVTRPQISVETNPIVTWNVRACCVTYHVCMCTRCLLLHISTYA